MSRLENGRKRAWNVEDLRRLAEVYGIPPRLLGLSTSTTDSRRDSLTTDLDNGGEDPMHRPDLLAGTAAVATGAILFPPADWTGRRDLHRL